MTIEYSLVENKLTAAEGIFRAMVQPKETIGLDEIVERIVRRGSTLMREDVMAVLEAYHDTIYQLTADGNNITTPTANYSLSIKGVFRDVDDSFDPARHRLEVRVNSGQMLRRKAEHMHVTKIEASVPRPNPLTFQDPASSNGSASPGSGGKIKGHRLKFDEADPQQGVFFVAEDGAVVRVNHVLSNKPGEVIFIVPTLTAGSYQLEVRALFGKQLRRGLLEKAIIIA
jgi:hypothetical protein